MSEQRYRVFNSARKYTQEMAIEKENIYYSRQMLQTVSTNRVISYNSQKVLPRRRNLSEDLECCCCPCNAPTVKQNEATSANRRTPFGVHYDRAGSDFNKGLRFRERISEYETRRVEEIKRRTRVNDYMIEKTEEKVASMRKQQLESNFQEDHWGNYNNVAIVRNSAVPVNKSKIRSIDTCSGYNYLTATRQSSNTRSCIDLTQEDKPRIVTTKTTDIVKKSSVYLTPHEQNLNNRRSASTQSINKVNDLEQERNRVISRSRSCSNQRSVDSAKNRVTSTESSTKVPVKYRQVKPTRPKKVLGSNHSVLAGSEHIFLNLLSQKEGASSQKKGISSEKKEISSQKKEISSQKKEISSQKKEISSQKKEISSQKKEISSEKKEISSQKKEIPSQKKEISSEKKEISSQKKEISSQKKEISSQKKEISSQKKEISSQKKEISSQKKEISSQKKEISPKKKAISPQKKDVSSKIDEIWIINEDQDCVYVKDFIDLTDVEEAEEAKEVKEDAKEFKEEAKKEEKSNDEAKQPLVQAKVESDPQAVKQNADVSAYLLYNAEYLQDLLHIEKEKEEVEPKLSSEFIDKYINNEPRKIIVTYLIRLCAHCRYPSFILYQTVKLFDAIIDRIAIEKSDMQLAALTTLWIVLKKDGNFDKIPSAKSTLALAQDVQVNTNVLAEWERVILVALNFNITFSDPFSIFVFYVINYDYKPNVSNGIITKIYYCGGYVIDLTLLDVQFSYTTSNHLALATAELVMCIVLDDEDHLSAPRWRYWREMITTGADMPISYYDDEINFLRAAMIVQVLKSAKKHTKEETVRKKYNHSRYGNISEYFIDRIKKIPRVDYSISMSV